MATYRRHAPAVVTVDQADRFARCTCADFRADGHCQHTREAMAQQGTLSQIKLDNLKARIEEMSPEQLYRLELVFRWNWPEHDTDEPPLTDEEIDYCVRFMAQADSRPNSSRN